MRKNDGYCSIAVDGICSNLHPAAVLSQAKLLSFDRQIITPSMMLWPPGEPPPELAGPASSSTCGVTTESDLYRCLVNKEDHPLYSQLQRAAKRIESKLPSPLIDLEWAPHAQVISGPISPTSGSRLNTPAPLLPVRFESLLSNWNPVKDPIPGFLPPAHSALPASIPLLDFSNNLVAEDVFTAGVKELISHGMMGRRQSDASDSFADQQYGAANLDGISLNSHLYLDATDALLPKRPQALSHFNHPAVTGLSSNHKEENHSALCAASISPSYSLPSPGISPSLVTTIPKSRRNSTPLAQPSRQIGNLKEKEGSAEPETLSKSDSLLFSLAHQSQPPIIIPGTTPPLQIENHKELAEQNKMDEPGNGQAPAKTPKRRLRAKPKPVLVECDYPGCSRTFPNRELLRSHRRIHLRKREFPCIWRGPNGEKCESIMYRKQDLERHHLTHLPFKGFFCDACERSFTRKDGLVRHIGRRRCGKRVGADKAQGGIN
ncbi:hypothetical protein HDU67_010039 [Dinochytrium kinnereticum]|nr:hypothetical protein HDU67_010039 [Dinochytrium kinnereticum]